MRSWNIFSMWKISMRLSLLILQIIYGKNVADRRIWPAIDIRQSGTRHEEKLMDEEELNNSSALRRTMTSMDPADAMQRLVGVLEKSNSNEEFFSKYMKR